MFVLQGNLVANFFGGLAFPTPEGVGADRRRWCAGGGHLTDMDTWYDVLGVGPEADASEVRAAYRSNARALHPDSRDPDLPAGEADAALRLLNQAWAVLGDPATRAAYDASLATGEADGPPADAFHHRPRFPWWIVVLVVLFAIFVFTAYAGAPPPRPD